ncbi:MAG: hypothetical protein J6B43_02965 [Lachnospiraceae bacterium]|nr:hypothetical protein [Lachnospiraceae bacterium]
MLKQIINLRNIFAAITILSAMAVPGALEAEMYFTASALIVGTGISACLTMREDGSIRHKK